jgi:hypothetical protein
MFSACLLVLIAGSMPALALEDCNQIKKLEDRLQCLQRNIDALLRDSTRSIQIGEPVLLHSRSGNSGCIATSQYTVFMKVCQSVGPEEQWSVESISK